MCRVRSNCLQLYTIDIKNGKIFMMVTIKNGQSNVSYLQTISADKLVAGETNTTELIEEKFENLDYVSGDMIARATYAIAVNERNIWVGGAYKIKVYEF